eukprot:9468201-Pyramimonas_sp.AAC.1
MSFLGTAHASCSKPPCTATSAPATMSASSQAPSRATQHAPQAVSLLSGGSVSLFLPSPQPS